MSVVDVLFNCGPASLDIVLSGNDDPRRILHPFQHSGIALQSAVF
jgi:hypothetical protein